MRGWGLMLANLREVAASLRHFVRLPARDDVARAQTEVASIRRAARATEAELARLERAGATSRPASPGRGTP